MLVLVLVLHVVGLVLALVLVGVLVLVVLVLVLVLILVAIYCYRIHQVYIIHKITHTLGRNLNRILHDNAASVETQSHDSSLRAPRAPFIVEKSARKSIPGVIRYPSCTNISTYGNHLFYVPS